MVVKIGLKCGTVTVTVTGTVSLSLSLLLKTAKEEYGSSVRGSYRRYSIFCSLQDSQAG